MAIALVVLAIGSVAAGYVGVPASLHGSNQWEHFLAPSFEAPTVVAIEGGLSLAIPATDTRPAADAAAEEGSTGTELGLMGLSVLVAFAGIGVATLIWKNRPAIADTLAERFSDLHKLLLGKYYVDELYDAVIVQPIKRLSTFFLWRGVDAGLIDGTVNGVGFAVRGSSAVLRRLQTGSVRAYAMSIFVGVVAIVGYFLWR
jgi:NADH-quinone oxidoreductase subunit L